MTRATGLLVSLLLPGLAEAGGLTGSWVSPPDGKGQTGVVVMRPCDGGGGSDRTYCGTLVKVFGPDREAITTPNIGKRLLFDLQPDGDAVYSGWAYVPAFDAAFPAEVVVRGDALEVSGCAMAGALCRSQEWRRIE